jgi:trigger factor
VKIEVVKTEGVRRTIAITADEADVVAVKKNAANAVRAQAKIPGFRPGKAPDALLFKMYGDAVTREIRYQLREQALRLLNVFHGGGEILAIVTLDIPEIAEGVSIVINVEVDLRPEFELPDYNNIPLADIESLVASDEVVDGHLKEIAEVAKTRRIVDDRPIREGDNVHLVVIGTFADGTPVPSGEDPAQGYVIIDPEDPDNCDVHEISQGIVGMFPGEDNAKEITVTYPEDYKVPCLAGHSVIYKCTIISIAESVVPALDDAFAKGEGFKDLEDLRDRTREMIAARRFVEEFKDRSAIVRNFLCNSVDFPIPESLMAEIPPEDIKLSLIADAIAKKEGIEISNEDMLRCLLQKSVEFDQDIMDIIRGAKKDERQMRHLKKACQLYSVVDLLVRRNLGRNQKVTGQLQTQITTCDSNSFPCMQVGLVDNLNFAGNPQLTLGQGSFADESGEVKPTETSGTKSVLSEDATPCPGQMELSYGKDGEPCCHGDSECTTCSCFGSDHGSDCTEACPCGETKCSCANNGDEFECTCCGGLLDEKNFPESHAVTERMDHLGFAATQSESETSPTAV